MKQAQQKGKLLALQRILWQQSDAEHPLSATALIELLAAQMRASSSISGVIAEKSFTVNVLGIISSPFVQMLHSKLYMF